MASIGRTRLPAGADIDKIAISTYQAALTLCDKPDPRTAPDAKFSLQYCVASALRHGRVGLAEFAEAALHDGAVRALLPRIDVVVEPAREAAYPDCWSAAVRVTLADGRTFDAAQDRRLDVLRALDALAVAAEGARHGGRIEPRAFECVERGRVGVGFLLARVTQLVELARHHNGLLRDAGAAGDRLEQHGAAIIAIHRLEAVAVFHMAKLMRDDGEKRLLVVANRVDKAARCVKLAAWQGHRIGQFDIKDCEGNFKTRIARDDQRVELARALSKLTGVPVWLGVFHRTKRTVRQGSQGGMSGRWRNVAGAFRTPNRGRILGKKLVLIDDVWTSGATLDACARTLTKAGASEVTAITVARVVRQAETAL